MPGQFEAHRLLDGAPEGGGRGVGLPFDCTDGEVGLIGPRFPLVLCLSEAYSQV